MIGLLTLFAVAALLIIAMGSAVTIHYITHPPRLTYAAALAHDMPTSPADLGLAAAERIFQLPDGNQTPGWIITGHEPRGPIIIVTHGWGDSRFGSLGWAGLLTSFASQVVVYDLRAHGNSTGRKSGLGTVEVDDLLAIIDQVQQSTTRVVLFGASIGVGISIVAAERAPEKIAGVIGDGGYRHGMEPIVGFFRANRIPVWPFYLPIGLHLAFWFISASKFDRAKHAAKLQRPLLMLHGTADPICPCASAQHIAAAAPRGRIVLFENGGHLDLASLDEKRYLDALAEFFSKLNPSPIPLKEQP